VRVLAGQAGRKFHQVGFAGAGRTRLRQPFHDPASVYQVVNMMLGVTTRGTAGQLAVLGRPIAGKTGTTNDARDNWFLGSTPDITVGIYVGFDEPRTLGDQETGGGTSAPVYERIARTVFKGKPPVPFRIPPGVRIVRVDHDSGLPSSGGNSIDEVSSPAPSPAPRVSTRPRLTARPHIPV